VISEFATPTAFSTPSGITAGPDGALWFTEFGSNAIGRITTSGSFSEFPTPTVLSRPFGVAVGPDGALWFTENDKIGRVTMSGSFTEFPLPTAGSGLEGIAAGPDGALWFTEELGGKIGRITTGGSVSEFTIPTPDSAPRQIVTGPDGALWFTEGGNIGAGANKIGRITIGGSFTEFAVPTASSEPFGIAAGPHGALWFTERAAGKIGRLTTSGSFTEFAIPTAGSVPDQITAGPDGALWFTDNDSKIGRITLPPTTLTLSPKTASNDIGTTHCVTATVNDGAANPTTGVTVRFAVTGSVNTSGSVATDADGHATFCYEGPELPGADAISAFADTDNDGTQGPGEPSNTATKDWTLPKSTCNVKVAAEGQITAADGDRASFDGHAHSDHAGKVEGEERYHDRGPANPQHVISIEILALTCNPARTQATVFGTATIDGSGTHTFRIDVQDLDEPGVSTDTYRILLDTGYDSGVQALKRGHVHIHEG